MKLHTSPTSPYGRKCRMVAYLAGVALENVDADYKAPEYAALNPLSKVPSLELSDGRVLIDSPVISAYIAAQGDAGKVYPGDDDMRWSSLSLEALADGITDAAVLAFLENARADGEKSQVWLDKQYGKMNAGLDVIETMAESFGDRTDIGVLAVAGGLSWIDLRNVGGDWREGRPHLTAWWARFAEQDCWLATADM